jgi:hypothetical protein
MSDVLTAKSIVQNPEWLRLQAVLAAWPETLADLRSPLDSRIRRMNDLAADMEASGLKLIQLFVTLRNEVYPNPAQWNPGKERYPQPDPTTQLAVREWILSLTNEPSVPLNRQKRLSRVLTEILVAQAAVQTYSSRLDEPSSSPLVRMLSALWLLVAGCWQLRPLLLDGPSTRP